MKITNIFYSIVFLIFSISSTALSEQSTSSTGKYINDLGEVYGAIQGTKFLKEICTEKYPSLRRQNNTAYKKWRIKYKPFLQEIEWHYLRMVWNEAKGDPEKDLQLKFKYNKIFKASKKGLATQLQNDGDQVFFRVCKNYPISLITVRMNYEYFYAEQVQTIRKKTK